MFFGFQLTLGLMMAFYGFSVMKNPRVWGDQGRRAVKAENFEEYCRQNGQFFLKAGCVVAVIGALDALITLDALLYIFGLAFAFYPLTLPAGASRTRAFPGRGPTSRARKSALKSCAANSRHRRTRKKGKSDPPDKA